MKYIYLHRLYRYILYASDNLIFRLNGSHPLRVCKTRWSAKEITSVALSTEQERHTENGFHIILRQSSLEF